MTGRSDMTAKRIFTAALATETNTFSPIVIDRRGFEDAFTDEQNVPFPSIL